MSQMGFYFDQTRCTGCHTCRVACKDWHDLQSEGVNWMQIETIEKGTFPHLFLAFMATPCYQCETPACMAACPSEAISKRVSDGIVVVDPDACLGREKCEKTPCLKACRSRVPQFGPEENAKMQKCDFCLERLDQGKQPICVEACPMFALEIDTLTALQKKYGSSQEAAGFRHPIKLKPAVVFTPKPENYS
ncbi:MAG: 4Fe-4S dicluster domain-containing protein [Deltaproteobacteria bacterium]|nr:4Fe-4S dicluster domain-containing protein [Deltaproteobacteria bacterium]